MLNRKIIVMIMAGMLLVPAVLAAGVDVIKTAPPSIKFGNLMNVTITVVNNLDHGITTQVAEVIGNAEPVSQELVVPVGRPGIIAALPPYFEWTLDIGANSQKNVSYIIKPRKAGFYTFSPTTVTVGGETFYSNALSTIVECNSNGICEAKLGEDAISCKSDCVLTGKENDYCDGVKDNVCDPDCYPEQDSDCPTGVKDNYCDGVKDNVCDMDCTPESDADCAAPGTNKTGISLPTNVDPLALAGVAILVLAAFLFYAFKMAGKGEDLYR